jgi:hypothetical protein
VLLLKDITSIETPCSTMNFAVDAKTLSPPSMEVRTDPRAYNAASLATNFHCGKSILGSPHGQCLSVGASEIHLMACESHDVLLVVGDRSVIPCIHHYLSCANLMRCAQTRACALVDCTPIVARQIMVATLRRVRHYDATCAGDLVQEKRHVGVVVALRGCFFIRFRSKNNIPSRPQSTGLLLRLVLRGLRTLC